MFLIVFLVGYLYVRDWQGVLVQVGIGGVLYGVVIFFLAKQQVKENLHVLIHRR